MPQNLVLDAACICLSGETYAACCGRFHTGQSWAATAEQLMRSRYSAFAAHYQSYLLQTWHPQTRPAEVGFDDDLQWRRLDILRTDHGGPLDTAGTVRFMAHYRSAGQRGFQEETSSFMRIDHRWFYVDGVQHN